MNSAKYEATKDEFTLLFKEWARTVEAFNKSEEIIDHPEIRNVVREYFKYAIRDCTMAFTRILDSLLDEKVERGVGKQIRRIRHHCQLKRGY